MRQNPDGFFSSLRAQNKFDARAALFPSVEEQVLPFFFYFFTIVNFVFVDFLF